MAADALTAAIAALIGADAAAEDRFGVAVSGGPDSLALLLLAHAAFGDRVAAASVDHRLRAEAGAECARVAAICTERAIEHHILTADSPPDPPSQAGARTLRYALLERWSEAQDIDWLLTGHHADDQVETLVMRLNRRSGVGGLSGIRARNGRVLRPLLGWTRAELRAIVDAAGLVAIDDPTNRDPRHDRSRVRAALSDSSLFDAAAVAESVARLAQAEDALDWATAQSVAQRVVMIDDNMQIETSDLPDEILHRMISKMLGRGTPHPPRGGDVARLIASLRSGDIATLGGWRGAPDRAAATLWHFSRAAPRRNHA